MNAWQQAEDQVTENAAALDEGERAYQAGARTGLFEGIEPVTAGEPQEIDRSDMLAWQIKGDIKRLTSLMFAAQKMGMHATAEALGEDLDELLEGRP